jgi:hypothetical protein
MVDYGSRRRMKWSIIASENFLCLGGRGWCLSTFVNDGPVVEEKNG